MNRNYRTSASAKLPVGPPPDEFFRAYGRLEGWEFVQNNLMVEGTTDVRYLQIANERYVEKNDHSLIDDSFGVLAIGEAQNGGTYAMKEKLNTLWRIRQLAGQAGAGCVCRVIALLDDDEAGRDAFQHIQKRGARPWIDLFLLRRRNPQVAQPSSFKNECERANEHYLQDKKFFCVVEDLINLEVIEEFRRQHPGCFRRDIHHFADAFHADVHTKFKGGLVRFVDQNAMLSDLLLLIELLQAFRCLLQLPPEGSPVR